jgi:hypothetical protein
VVLALSGGSAAAAYIPTPPGIVLDADASVCGQVTVTAKGFGLHVGETYQLVADRAVKTAIASSSNVAVATFSFAEAGEWGVVAIRTSSGGYLAASATLGAGTAWYHARAC